jgi:signal transduction histidine kinase
VSNYLNLPIARGEALLGSLWLGEKEDDRRFTEADEAAMKALSAHAAVALHHLHLLGQQRALVSRLIEAQEEEHRRVAYELHDGLTQYVMAAHAHLEAFRPAHESGKQEKATLELNQGLQYLKEAVVESRRLVNGLRPLALDDLGLARALEQLLAEEKSRAGWTQADLEENIQERRFHRALETAVYRVAQEALTNARKHADATRAHVRLLVEVDPQTGAPCLSLEVRDWGRGIAPEQGSGGHGHLGLQSMRERVTRIGGNYTVWTAPGEGTTVCAVFPVRDTP